MQFVYKLFPPKWRILTMKTLSSVCILLIVAGIQQYIATFFPFPAMLYLPCADHVILVVHDVVTS